MREFFSTTDHLASQAEYRGYCELRIDDSDSSGWPHFVVTESHCMRFATDRNPEWKDAQIEHCFTLEEAYERYAARRLGLIQTGFMSLGSGQLHGYEAHLPGLNAILTCPQNEDLLDI